MLTYFNLKIKFLCLINYYSKFPLINHVDNISAKCVTYDASLNSHSMDYQRKFGLMLLQTLF